MVSKCSRCYLAHDPQMSVWTRCYADKRGAGGEGGPMMLICLQWLDWHGCSTAIV